MVAGIAHSKAIRSVAEQNGGSEACNIMLRSSATVSFSSKSSMLEKPGPAFAERRDVTKFNMSTLAQGGRTDGARPEPDIP